MSAPTPGPLRVALLQLGVTDGAPDPNLDGLRAAMPAPGAADLIVLPELWTTGYDHSSWERVARNDTERVLVVLQSLATGASAAIAGSMASVTEGGLVNRLWVVFPDGRAPRWYDKGHLFAPMAEPQYLVPGSRRERVEIAGWPAALSICYDLRFPEMYRLDALDGAALFIVASCWPAERADTQRLFARARATENQAYLALCNRAGRGRDGTTFAGHSALIAPDGTVVAEAGEQPGTALATASWEQVAHVRGSLPVFRDRRQGLDWATS